ncbi:MAG: hypothetical protein IPL94_08985 [Tetrasphaera sp.]|nr:hypothetical protein [Tetrasphaera sp.]
MDAPVGKSTLLGAICGRVPHFTGEPSPATSASTGRDTRQHRLRDLADLGVVGQGPARGVAVTDTVDENRLRMEQLGFPCNDAQAGRGDLDVLGTRIFAGRHCGAV